MTCSKSCRKWFKNNNLANFFTKGWIQILDELDCALFFQVWKHQQQQQQQQHERQKTTTPTTKQKDECQTIASRNQDEIGQPSKKMFVGLSLDSIQWIFSFCYKQYKMILLETHYSDVNNLKQGFPNNSGFSRTWSEVPEFLTCLNYGVQHFDVHFAQQVFALFNET